MLRAVLYDETLYQAIEKVRAVRQIRPDNVMKDFGEGPDAVVHQLEDTPCHVPDVFLSGQELNQVGCLLLRAES